MNCRFQDKRPGCFSITGTISGVFWGEVSVKIPGQSVLDSQEEIKEMKMTKKQEKKKEREKAPLAPGGLLERWLGGQLRAKGCSQLLGPPLAQRLRQHCDERSRRWLL